MARNVEIKARVEDIGAVRDRVIPLASSPPQSLEQTDTFFVVPKGRLKVRAFADGSGELIPYERSNQPAPRESVYKRVFFQNAGALVEALGLALPVRGVVVKRREVLTIGRTRIHLDRVEGLGSFVEIEVVLTSGEPAEQGYREAAALLRALHIPDDALVAEAYIDLLERR